MPEVEVAWYEDGEWRGFLPVQPRSELLRLFVFDTWVAGVHHYPDSAVHESFAPGQQLALVAEPDNPTTPRRSESGTPTGRYKSVTCQR